MEGKAKFSDKYPFLHDAAIVAVGVVVGGILLMGVTHFAKPLIASAMGNKGGSSAASSTGMAAPAATAPTTTAATATA